MPPILTYRKDDPERESHGYTVSLGDGTRELLPGLWCHVPWWPVAFILAGVWLFWVGVPSIRLFRREDGESELPISSTTLGRCLITLALPSSPA